MAEAVQQADVVRVTDLTPHVREIILSPADQKISYQPGQWVSIKVPINQKPPLNRAYSMAEPEQPSGQLSLVFDRVPGGIGSEYLYSLQPGDQVSLSGPHGKFLLPAQIQKELFLIGRYTGIVPIRCMIRALVSANNTSALTVIQAAPAEDELLYQNELIELAASRSNFHFIPVISAPPLETDRVIELLSQLIKDRRDVVPMICGIKQFARPLRGWFIELGFDRHDVKIETYD
jgi:phenol hydroxylase P5 protein